MISKQIYLFVFFIFIILAASVLRLNISTASAEALSATQSSTEQSKASGTTGQTYSASHAAREEKSIQDARRQLLSEKEAALAVKEQELKKLSAKLESQLRSIEENKKRVDDSLKAKAIAQKKPQDEKILKMVKLFKTLKSEQAGKLLDGLPENQALRLLSKMDTKSVAKLTPFINQPRVLKWINDNLSE